MRARPFMIIIIFFLCEEGSFMTFYIFNVILICMYVKLDYFFKSGFVDTSVKWFTVKNEGMRFFSHQSQSSITT